MTSVFSFDLDDRLTHITHASQAATLFEVGYGYDPAGNRVFAQQRTPGLTDRSAVYAYDQRHRLRRVERGTMAVGLDPAIETPLGDDALAAVQEWPADPANPGLDRRGNWNVFSEMIGQTPATTTQTRVPNGVNEYETIDPDGSGPLSSVALQHDPAGNLTLDALARNHDDPPGLGNETGQAYEYDEENRLTAVRRASSIPGSDDPQQQAGAPLLEIRYDALGRRVEGIDYTGLSDPNAACPGQPGAVPVLTRHIYAGIETLEEHICCDLSGSGVQCADASGFALAREFVWGDRFPQPVAMIDHTDLGAIPGDGSPGGGPEVLHYLHEALGSVVALTDSTGAVVERYTYEPYGRTIIEQTDPATGEPIARLSASRFGNPFCWTAQRYEAGVGLYHFLFRSYSPRLGRWLQRDPVGYHESLNLRQYVMGRVTRFRDPLGLLAQAGGDDVDYVDPKNVEYSRSLARRINEVQKRIYKRIKDLKDNPLDLPETHPDGDKCPRKSRRGHRRLIKQDQELLQRLKSEYQKRCGGRWPRFPVPEPQPKPRPQPGSPPPSGPIPRVPEAPPVVDPPVTPPLPRPRPGPLLPRHGPWLPQPPVRCRDCHRPGTPFYPF